MKVNLHSVKLVQNYRDNNPEPLKNQNCNSVKRVCFSLPLFYLVNQSLILLVSSLMKTSISYRYPLFV